jgi:hypothetical protein
MGVLQFHVIHIDPAFLIDPSSLSELSLTDALHFDKVHAKGNDIPSIESRTSKLLTFCAIPLGGLKVQQAAL